MYKHFLNIILNVSRTFLPSFTILLFSYIVINKFEKEIWGDFVSAMLLVNLLVHFSQWGSKEYLLRNFSNSPGNISIIFYQNIFTRGLLLIPVILLLFLYTETVKEFLLLLIWSLSLFIYQSAESLIVFSKKFIPLVLIEFTSLGILCLSLFSYSSLSKVDIIQLFAGIYLFKALFVYIIYFPKFRFTQLSRSDITLAFPFFIIGLSGLLQSRIDQYIIAAFSDKNTISDYQILLSSFILLQALSAVIIVPFNKALYRLNLSLFNTLFRKFIILGVIIVSAAGPIISLALIYLYHIDLPILYFITGILFALPPFIFVPIIYLFYRAGKEKEVMIINYIGAAFNLLFTFLLVQYGTAYDALIASTIAQWGMLGWYLYRKQQITQLIIAPKTTNK